MQQRGVDAQACSSRVLKRTRGPASQGLPGTAPPAHHVLFDSPNLHNKYLAKAASPSPSRSFQRRARLESRTTYLGHIVRSQPAVLAKCTESPTTRRAEIEAAIEVGPFRRVTRARRSGTSKPSYSVRACSNVMYPVYHPGYLCSTTIHAALLKMPRAWKVTTATSQIPVSSYTTSNSCPLVPQHHSHNATGWAGRGPC